MATIKNCTLTPELTQFLVAEIGRLPDELLDQFGKEFMPGGFTKVRAIRERLVMMVRGPGALPPLLVSFLAEFLPARDLIESLSTKAIAHCLAQLPVVYGREKILLHLLIDSREEVHRLGVESLNKLTGPRPAERERVMATQGFLMYVLETFVQDLPKPPSLPTGAAVEEDDDNSAGLVMRIDELEEKVETLEKANGRLTRELHDEKDRNQRKLREQSERAEQERQRIIGEREAARTEAHRMRKERNAFEEQLKKMTVDVDAQVAEKVRQETALVTRKWLAEPIRLEAELASISGTTDLLARAERALEAQARQDAYSGKRRELEQKLQTLKNARHQLSSALQTAIVPIGELKDVLREVEHEIQKIEKTLGANVSAGALASQVLILVNGAPDWQRAREYSELIAGLSGHGLLTEKERRQLYDALHRRFSLLEERERPKGIEIDSGWSLRGALYRNKNTLLLLDGYNILFCLRELFEPVFENGRPGKKARDKLVQLTEKLVRSRNNIRTTICFDAPEAASFYVVPNLYVEFTGGHGSNRADQLILQHLQFRDLKSIDQKVYVVTDDREIQREITKTAGTYVPTAVFAVLLADFGCDLQAR